MEADAIGSHPDLALHEQWEITGEALTGLMAFR